jgi:hypothetical protein
MSKHNRQRRERRRVMDELTKDRHYIIEKNVDLIRSLARDHPGHLIVAAVDCPPLLEKAFGSAEAGGHYQAYRASRGENSVAWMAVPWDDADAAMVNSENWPQAKALAERLGNRHALACVLNGRDGVGMGYTYSVVPIGD